MIKSQRIYIEKNKLIEDGNRMGIDEIIRQNEGINNNLKSQLQNNPIVLLKCKKSTENKNPRVSKTSNGKKCY